MLNYIENLIIASLNKLLISAKLKELEFWKLFLCKEQLILSSVTHHISYRKLRRTIHLIYILC